MTGLFKTRLMLVVLILLAFIVGCATINAIIEKKELTPPAKYYDALKTFNSNVERYLEVFKLSDAATQAKWKAQIDPLIKIASTALDSWKAALNSPTAAGKEEAWNKAKTNFISILLSSGIITIEQGGK